MHRHMGNEFVKPHPSWDCGPNKAWELEQKYKERWKQERRYINEHIYWGEKNECLTPRMIMYNEIWEVIQRVGDGLYLKQDVQLLQKHKNALAKTYPSLRTYVPDHWFPSLGSMSFREVIEGLTKVIEWNGDKNDKETRRLMLIYERDAFLRRKRYRPFLYEIWAEQNCALNAIPRHIFKHVIVPYACGSRVKTINRMFKDK